MHQYLHNLYLYWTPLPQPSDQRKAQNQQPTNSWQTGKYEFLLKVTMCLQLQHIITKGCLPVSSFFLVFYSDVKFVRIFTAKHQKDNQNTVYLVIFHDYLIFTFLRYHLNCKLLNTQFCIIFNKKFIKSQKKMTCTN